MSNDDNQIEFRTGDQIATIDAIDMGNTVIPAGTIGDIVRINGDWVDCAFVGYRGTWSTTLKTICKPVEEKSPPTGDSSFDQEKIIEVVNRLSTGNQYIVTKDDLDAIENVPQADKHRVIKLIQGKLNDPALSTGSWDYGTAQKAFYLGVGLALLGDASIDPVLSSFSQHPDDPKCLEWKAITLGKVAELNSLDAIDKGRSERAVEFMTGIIEGGSPTDELVWKTVESVGKFRIHAGSAESSLKESLGKLDRIQHRQICEIYDLALAKIGAPS